MHGRHALARELRVVGADAAPVDHVEEGVDVLGPAVLVLEVVRAPTPSPRIDEPSISGLSCSPSSSRRAYPCGRRRATPSRCRRPSPPGERPRRPPAKLHRRLNAPGRVSAAQVRAVVVPAAAVAGAARLERVLLQVGERDRRALPLSALFSVATYAAWCLSWWNSIVFASMRGSSASYANGSAGSPYGSPLGSAPRMPTPGHGGRAATAPRRERRRRARRARGADDARPKAGASSRAARALFLRCLTFHWINFGKLIRKLADATGARNP